MHWCIIKYYVFSLCLLVEVSFDIHFVTQVSLWFYQTEGVSGRCDKMSKSRSKKKKEKAIPLGLSGARDIFR